MSVGTGNLAGARATFRWARFAENAPRLESFARQRLERRIAYLATIRGSGAPRVHPVSPFLGDGSLFIYMEPTSPKVADLRRDPRYSLHCSVEDNEGGGGEVFVTGHVMEVGEQDKRQQAFAYAKSAGYQPQPRHIVFELWISEVLATSYAAGRRRERWPSERT